MMEEVKEGESTLSVHGHNIKIIEVLKDDDMLTFLIVSQKLTGTGEYHVTRTYDDFEWLQQHLFSQEDVPGIQGVIFPPLPAKAQVNVSAKALKQLGVLGLGEWQLYSQALETFLRHVATHATLSKNSAVETFLTSTDPPGRHRARKNLFNRLSQVVDEKRKEGYKDVDEFFQNERDHCLVLTGSTKTAVEKFLDVIQSEQKIAVACGHFAAALHLCVEPGDDLEKEVFSKLCVRLSEVLESMKKNVTLVAANDACTLGLALDLESRYQEAKKEMLFRRTSKLVELEAARRNADKAKPPKKAAMDEVKKAAQEEFDHISARAQDEISRLQAVRVEMMRKALVQWCEKQLVTARDGLQQFNQHLESFRGMTW
ncbi:sorting nexin-5 [Nelusetta ayraudi]|uniref:sorting nexin-5 n=1 Tax=Nelusetta ayraudi TaxID=303726 RepID=UPI003F72241F